METLSPELWTRVEELFDAACDMAEGERAKWLEAHCSDPFLREQVITLLAFAGDEGRQIAAVVSGAAERLATEKNPDARLLGRRLGAYRIDSIIGSGGMGAVYLAVRDDEQYLQQVAIKLVHVASVGHAALLRFRQERQILARLEHPNIARLLDGGTTDEDIPYLVMEYVDGKPITGYCEDARLKLRDRLALFLKVCDAVDFAHRNLVVHRDLKPQNIFINQSGEPKLLDFGIAKLMDPAADTEQATRSGMIAMTPDYASPEQVRGDAISTATDVYSLGAVLYTLLTGAKAHRLKDYTPASIAEAVCDTMVARPSESVANPRIRRELQGDLDNIILHAMRKEPERRYRSAAEFAADIKRYLEGRPVQARADTFTYRSGKFLRRNRLGVMAATLLLVAISVGAAATLWQARRAERRFQQVRSLANSFVFEVHDKIADLAGSTEVRELVVRRGLEYLDSLAAEAGGDETLQLEIAAGYVKIGDVQGNVVVANLGKPEEALRRYEKALQLANHLERARIKSLALDRLLAKVHLSKGQVLSSLGAPQAEWNLREAIRIAEAMPADEGVPRLALLRSAYFGIWTMAETGGQVAKGIETTRSMLALSEQIYQAEPTDQHRYDRAIAAQGVAKALGDSGAMDDAITGHREAIASFRELHRKDPRNATYFRDFLGAQIWMAEALGDARYANIGDTVAAEEHYRQALALAKELYRQDVGNERWPHDLAEIHGGLGVTLRDRDPKAAAEYLRLAIEGMDAAPASVMGNIRYRSDQAEYHASIAYPMRKLGRYAEARQHLERALAALRDLAVKQAANNSVKSVLTAALLELAALEKVLGNKAATASAAKEALRVIEPAVAANQDNALLALRLAESYQMLGQIDSAGQWYALQRNVWEQWRKSGRPAGRFFEYQLRAAPAAMERVQ